MMKPISAALAAMVMLGCGGGGGGGGGSTEARCNNWCERRNADTDCGAPFQCAATCTSFEFNYATRCPSQYGALLTCLEDTEDQCVAGQPMACSAENTALVQCVNDAGP